MELKILSEEEREGGIVRTEVELLYKEVFAQRGTWNGNYYIGCDPGVTNFALAILDPRRDSAILFKGEIKRDKDAVRRMSNTQRFVKACMQYPANSILPVIYAWAYAVVEGASYGAVYRQVELAEARTVMVMTLQTYGASVRIVPPKTIRKVAFGSGEIKNPWDNINDDCASALGCAYHAYLSKGQ